jgi:hypothetical protein
MCVLVALLLINVIDTKKSEALDIAPIDTRPAQIDKYFSDRNMPLEGYGELMVAVADEHDLDWRLLPAIAVREQSGGKVLPHNCPGTTKNYNAFGWGSGRICFTSFDEAIRTVGMKIGNTDSALKYYKGKTTYAKLQTYNPPSVVKTYAEEVIAIMNAIGVNE